MSNDNNDDALWTARVESLEEPQIDTFKSFIKRRNAKAHLVGPIYDYARRTQWMLMGPLRQHLSEFFLGLDLDLPPTPQKAPVGPHHPANPSSRSTAPSLKPRKFVKPDSSDDESVRTVAPQSEHSISHPSTPTPQYRALPKKHTKASSITDSSEWSSDHDIVSSKKRKRRASPPKSSKRTKKGDSSQDEVEVLDICSTSEEDHPKGGRKGKGKMASTVKITRQHGVNNLIKMDTLPVYYPSPTDANPNDVAFLIDLHDTEATATRELAMETVLKNSDMDSWGRGTGTSMGQKAKEKGTQVDLLHGKARCSKLLCQGMVLCEHFKRDPDILSEDYARDAANVEDWAKIARAEMNRKEGLKKDPLYWSAVFFRSFSGNACTKSGCKGEHTICQTRGNPDRWFVGCSGWVMKESGLHSAYFPPVGPDRDLVDRMMRGEEIEAIPEGLEFCYNAGSPRWGETVCDEVHFVNGRLHVGQMVKIPCTVYRVAYTPFELEDRRAVVLFENTHNHPCFPEHKITARIQADVETAYAALGQGGVSGIALNRAASTRALNGGLTLQQKLPALQNNRLLRIAVSKASKKEYTHGTDWEGVINVMLKEADTPHDRRYFWEARINGKFKILVTMLPSLACRIHKAQEIVCDFTFKRVFGDMNEWEGVIWDQGLEMRLTVARIYSNAKDTAQFTRLWEAFFEAVSQATGASIRLRMLHNEGAIAFITDAEAAQALGLANALMSLPGIDRNDWPNAEDILPYTLVTCVVHFNRNLNKLRSFVTKDEYEILRSIISAKTQAEIDHWSHLAATHSRKEVHENKTQHSWYIPSLNPLKSKISSELWAVVRHDSNIVESAHVATNEGTGIGLPLLHAIERARKHDEEVHMGIEDRLRNGIIPSRHNTDIDRMQNRNRRQTHAAKARHRTDAFEDGMEILNAQHLKMKEDMALVIRRKKELKEMRNSGTWDWETFRKLVKSDKPQILSSSDSEPPVEMWTEEDISIGLEEVYDPLFASKLDIYMLGLSEEAFQRIANGSL